MNIVLVNHYAGSPQHGMEYRPFYMAREWIRMGHAVTLIAASQSHLRMNQPVMVESIEMESFDGVDFIWLKTPRYVGNGVGRVANILAFVLRLMARAKYFSKLLKPDVVIASSTYPLDIYPSRRIATMSGAKLVFEVHDLWPLTPIELGNMSRHHPFIAVMQRAENYAYRYADKVVSMLPNTLDHMLQHGMAKEKFLYVPNGIVAAEWQEPYQPLPEAHADVLSRLRSSGQFLLGYAGAHGIANALEYLLEASRWLPSGVTVVLVGQGPAKKELQSLVSSNNLCNVRLLNPVPKSAVPKLLSEMDGLYIGWRRQPLYRFGVNPNKLMDYMMSGKPIIHAIDAANDAVAESGCGISIEPEDPGAIATAVEQLVEMTPGDRAVMGGKGRRYVLAHYEYSMLAKRFVSGIV
jgi:glycosyltransferase involved in cell wall biosynthesis